MYLCGSLLRTSQDDTDTCSSAYRAEWPGELGCVHTSLSSKKMWPQLNRSGSSKLNSKGGNEEDRKSNLTHTAPLVLVQHPACSTATPDLTLSPHGTNVGATAIPQLAGCDIFSVESILVQQVAGVTLAAVPSWFVGAVVLTVAVVQSTLINVCKQGQS